jgi:hypothetical protein
LARQPTFTKPQTTSKIGLTITTFRTDPALRIFVSIATNGNHSALRCPSASFRAAEKHDDRQQSRRISLAKDAAPGVE